MNLQAKTTEGTLKLQVNRLDNGKYEQVSVFIDTNGNIVPEKSKRIVVDDFKSLLIA